MDSACKGLLTVIQLYSCFACLQSLLPVSCELLLPRPPWLWGSRSRPHPTPVLPPPPPPAPWLLHEVDCPAPVLLQEEASLCPAANWPSLCAGMYKTDTHVLPELVDMSLSVNLFFSLLLLRSLPAPRSYSGAGDNWREGCYWRGPAGGSKVKLSTQRGRHFNMALYLVR